MLSDVFDLPIGGAHGPFLYACCKALSKEGEPQPLMAHTLGLVVESARSACFGPSGIPDGLEGSALRLHLAGGGVAGESLAGGASG